MIHAQDLQFATITPPAASVSGTSWTTTEVDTLGFDYLTIVCQFGALAANVAALKLTENDTVSGGGDGPADIVGTRLGTDADISGSTAALPVSSTDDNKRVIFEINLKNRKRFIDLVATAGSGASYMCAVAILSRHEVTPTTAAGRGVKNIMRL